MCKVQKDNRENVYSARERMMLLMVRTSELRSRGQVRTGERIFNYVEVEKRINLCVNALLPKQVTALIEETRLGFFLSLPDGSHLGFFPCLLHSVSCRFCGFPQRLTPYLPRLILLKVFFSVVAFVLAFSGNEAAIDTAVRAGDGVAEHVDAAGYADSEFDFACSFEFRDR